MKPKYKTTYENAIIELFKCYSNQEISYTSFTECLKIVCNNYRKEKAKYGN